MRSAVDPAPVGEEFEADEDRDCPQRPMSPHRASCRSRWGRGAEPARRAVWRRRERRQTHARLGPGRRCLRKRAASLHGAELRRNAEIAWFHYRRMRAENEAGTLTTAGTPATIIRLTISRRARSSIRHFKKVLGDKSIAETIGRLLISAMAHCSHRRDAWRRCKRAIGTARASGAGERLAAAGCGQGAAARRGGVVGGLQDSGLVHGHGSGNGADDAGEQSRLSRAAVWREQPAGGDSGEPGADLVLVPDD